MIHSLIKSDGTIIELTDTNISNELSSEAKSKFDSIINFSKFIGSDASITVFDLIEPSNTTLMCLAIRLADCISGHNDKLFMDTIRLNSLISQNVSLDQYINIANHCIERVDPKSDKFAYKDSKGIVSKYNSQDNLVDRFQVIVEPILYYYINEEPISVVVSDKFDVPYGLNYFTNILVWTKEQYEKLASLTTTSKESNTEK